MFHVNGRNINQVYPRGLELLRTHGQRENSRNGEVLVLPKPLVSEYNSPEERVLISESRRGNPFFHLFESLWMLAGKNNLDFLLLFNKRMADYSDDGTSVRGSAYGYRWRNFFEKDQLEFIISEINRNPSSRRLVLSQWSPEDLWQESKDLPCNTHVYFRVQNDEHWKPERLDITVSCRSNDMLFGGYGSNVVHFSFLQEYVALCCGLKIGKYYQVSNNAHVYVDTPVYARTFGKPGLAESYNIYLPDDKKYLISLIPLLDYPGEKKLFDEDCKDFVRDPDAFRPRSSFFKKVAMPMYRAHQRMKQQEYVSAIEEVQKCAAGDWRAAATLYINQLREK